MLLPDKHIRFGESLLGLGGFVLETLQRPKSIDELWTSLQKAMREGSFPGQHAYEHLVLAIDVLFAVGALELTESGALRRCN